MPEVAALFRDAGYHLENLTCLDQRAVEEMGHFSIAEEARAQELAESMKSKGYDALKVRSQVLIPKSKR